MVKESGEIDLPALPSYLGSMRIYKGWGELLEMVGPITSVAIGTFDGVHLGHQAFIKEMLGGIATNDAIYGAHNQHCEESLVITFWPHPRILTHPKTPLRYLQPLTERLIHLSQLGVQHLLILPFTSTISSMTMQEFLSELMSSSHLKHLWLGYDSTIGQGGPERMLNQVEMSSQCQRMGIELHRGKRFEITRKSDGVRLIPSSRLIREKIDKGLLKEASELLGREFSITGRVVKGRGVGRTLGFPTANLGLEGLSWEELALPPYGVYEFSTEQVMGSAGEIGGTKGVVNIGPLPSFSHKEISVEAHLIQNGECDLYGREITLRLERYIRPQKFFKTMDELQTQIRKDLKEILPNT